MCKSTYEIGLAILHMLFVFVKYKVRHDFYARICMTLSNWKARFQWRYCRRFTVRAQLKFSYRILIMLILTCNRVSCSWPRNSEHSFSTFLSSQGIQVNFYCEEIYYSCNFPLLISLVFWKQQKENNILRRLTRRSFLYFSFHCWVGSYIGKE